jgi:hypothetical protein
MENIAKSDSFLTLYGMIALWTLFNHARTHEALKNKWITGAFLAEYLSSIKDDPETFTLIGVNECISSSSQSIDLNTNTDGVYRMKCGSVYVYYITDEGGCCPRPENSNAVWVNSVL